MRSLTFRLCILALAIVAGLALSEISLRLLRLAPSDGVATVTARQYPTLTGIFAPNQELIDHRNRNLPHRVTIDSLGYRGRDLPRRKPAGEFRVLALGDSHVYGDFVDDDETLPAQLEAELLGGCGAVRVINAGLGGSTIIDQMRLLERALPLAPDLVILVFSENDVNDLAKPVSLWENLAENRRLKSETLLSVVYPALRRLALWNLALKVRARLAGRRQAAPAGRDSVELADLTVRLRRRYQEALIRTRDTLRALSIPLVFVAYPSHLTVSGSRPPVLLSWVLQTAQSAEIDTIDLLEPLRDTGLTTTTLFLLPHDGHPSPRGYAVAARHLADQLRDHEAVRNRCARQ